MGNFLEPVVGVVGCGCIVGMGGRGMVGSVWGICGCGGVTGVGVWRMGAGTTLGGGRVCGLVIVAGGVVSPGLSGGSSGGMSVGGVALDDGGVMSTRQSRAPSESRLPVRMVVPAALRIRSPCLSKCAVQPSSQSWPRLRRLLVNPGMIWPWRAVLLGRVGRASCADAVEVCWAPVAVRMVVDGAWVLRLMTGAVGIK